MTRKTTLIKILKLAALSPLGVSRRQFHDMSSSLTSAEIDLVRDSTYPRGLKHLVHEERIPTKGFYRTAWLLTSAGRQLLRDLQVNPEAIPVIPAGNAGFVSMAARQYAARLALKNRRRRKRFRKYQLSQKRGAKHHRREYDQLPSDINLLRLDPNSAEFRSLPSLQRVQILRCRTRSKAAK